MFIVARSRATSNRSVDILGLSSEFENKYLNEIMPGISVLTTRFGYFGFICWAISEEINPRSDDFRLLEDALAKTEYNCGKKYLTRRFKGIRNISGGSVPPYYLQSIFSDYRKTMEGMGLLTATDQLTEMGKRFATLFENKSKLLEVPKNLDLASRNGFYGIKKSMLRLSQEEKDDYKHIFFNGIKNNPDAKERALKRKKHKPLYEKLIRELEYDIDENVDATNMVLIDLLSKETKRGGKYWLAYEMSQYLSASYYCIKALHELYKELRKRKVEKIVTEDAVKIKTVRRCLERVSKFKKQQWLKSAPRAKDLHTLCAAHTLKDLLIKLIDRNMTSKEERAWFNLGKEDVIKLNPNDPPVPKEVSSFGIRLAPFESLTSDW